MSHRYPIAKKGKGPVLKRIQEHNLTLIGRLTNPKVQRLRSFIPFISQHWGLSGKAIGSDLGNGCFQFRFDSSEDLQKVLDNQPYHFAKYMVIIQKWEPKISDSFPNEILFWISVKGLPHRYWKEEMLLKIGDFIGNASTVDITSSSAKVRATVNGLKPLTKQLIIEFPKGEEVTVDLEYEKLRNHCRRCFSLCHDDRNCLEVINDTDKNPVLTIDSPDSRTDNHDDPLTARTKKCNSFSQRLDQPIRLFGPHTKSRREPHMEKASRCDHKNSSHTFLAMGAKKGKGPQSVVHAPPMLIGRLTNPKVQRLWSFIPFISQRWELTGKAIGSDLGNGCFQFCFDSSEDLQKVLDKQPYHFARYMVMIQKWEPEISDSFPNEITFWISVKGLPLRYWKEEMLLTIGDFIGNASTVDITSSAAKVRSTVNGLKPLTKQLIIEFPKGEEVTVDLEYEKLRNHCKRCFSLRHDDRNCLEVMGPHVAPYTDKGPVLTIDSPDSRTDNHEDPLTVRTSPKECKSFSQRLDKPLCLFRPRTKILSSRREPHMEKTSRRDHKNSSQQEMASRRDHKNSSQQEMASRRDHKNSQQEMDLESNLSHLAKELQRKGLNSSTRASPTISQRAKDHYPSHSGANLPPVTSPKPSPLLEWRKKPPKTFEAAPEPKPQPPPSYKNHYLLKHPVLETLARIRNNTSVFFLREFDFYQSYETCLKEGMCFWCKKNMLLYANFPCRHKLWCNSCIQEVTQSALGEKSLQENHHRCVICDAEVERFVSVSSV